MEMSAFCQQVVRRREVAAAVHQPCSGSPHRSATSCQKNCVRKGGSFSSNLSPNLDGARSIRPRAMKGAYDIVSEAGVELRESRPITSVERTLGFQTHHFTRRVDTLRSWTELVCLHLRYRTCSMKMFGRHRVMTHEYRPITPITPLNI